MCTILLVDEEPLQALTLKSILEKRFDDVRRVGDAAEALALLEDKSLEQSLQLVISGAHRSGLSGPAFVDEVCIRKPRLPVLVLGSANDDPASYTSDHVCYVPLPIEGKEMLELASQLIRLHEAGISAA